MFRVKFVRVLYCVRMFLHLVVLPASISITWCIGIPSPLSSGIHQSKDRLPLGVCSPTLCPSQFPPAPSIASPLSESLVISDLCRLIHCNEFVIAGLFLSRANQKLGLFLSRQDSQRHHSFYCVRTRWVTCHRWPLFQSPGFLAPPAPSTRSPFGESHVVAGICDLICHHSGVPLPSLPCSLLLINLYCLSCVVPSSAAMLLGGAASLIPPMYHFVSAALLLSCNRRKCL